MRNYCTLFDSAYMSKGLAMYESLRKYSSEPFTLYVLPIDEDCWRWLDYLRLPDVFLVSIAAMIRDKDLSALQKNRTRQHWCWTAASQLCEYLIDSGLDEITYLDADLFFFSDPEPVVAEIGNKSISVVEHRLIPSKQHLVVNGRFNVAFNYFKNNSIGRDCLSTWAAQVRERCDASTCGDQSYLDAWPAKYGAECHVVQHIGANVAPWNLAHYRVTDGPRVDGERVLWYHFHEYVHGLRLTNYELRPEDIELIYKPYIAAINVAIEQHESLRLLQR